MCHCRTSKHTVVTRSCRRRLQLHYPFTNPQSMRTENSILFVLCASSSICLWSATRGDKKVVTNAPLCIGTRLIWALFGQSGLVRRARLAHFLQSILPLKLEFASMVLRCSIITDICILFVFYLPLISSEYNCKEAQQYKCLWLKRRKRTRQAERGERERERERTKRGIETDNCTQPIFAADILCPQTKNCDSAVLRVRLL